MNGPIFETLWSVVILYRLEILLTSADMVGGIRGIVNELFKSLVLYDTVDPADCVYLASDGDQTRYASQKYLRGDL